MPSTWRHQARKNRYISIDPSTLGDREVAIRVELVEMNRCENEPRQPCRMGFPDDCRDFCDTNPNIRCTTDAVCGGGLCVPSGPCVSLQEQGHAPLVKWIQEPQQQPYGCRPAGACTDTDWFAVLGDTPYLRSWNDFGDSDSSVLHVTVCMITPVATYEVSFCLPPTFEVCGPALTVGAILKPVNHKFYGDVVGAVDPVTVEFPPPDGYVNVTDVTGYLLTNANWKDDTGFPRPQAHWTWVDLSGDGAPVYSPQAIMGVCDLGMILFGHVGQVFSQAGYNVDPYDCP